MSGFELRKFRDAGAVTTIRSLIDCYEQMTQFEQAEEWQRKWLVVVKDNSGPESVEYAQELAILGLKLLRQKKWADTEPLLRECLAIREKTQPDNWTTFGTKSLLGGSLLGQKKFGEAEPLLLAGYEGMKQRAAKIPEQGKVRLTEALERLVQLYEATDRPEDAAKWRQELENL